MKIRDLSIWQSFYVVAKEKSFTKASHKMNIGLALLSKRIANLEQELGVRLFQRTTRKVSLTTEGVALLPYVQSLLEDAESLELRFLKNNEISGKIRIACVTALCYRMLAPIIVEFKKIIRGFNLN